MTDPSAASGTTLVFDAIAYAYAASGTTAADAELDRLRAEVAALTERAEQAEAMAEGDRIGLATLTEHVAALTSVLDAARKAADEARDELSNIAAATAKRFEVDPTDFPREFVAWAQSRARHTLARVGGGA